MNAFCALVLNSGSTAMIGAKLVGYAESGITGSQKDGAAAFGGEWN